MARLLSSVYPIRTFAKVCLLDFMNEFTERSWHLSSRNGWILFCLESGSFMTPLKLIHGVAKLVVDVNSNVERMRNNTERITGVLVRLCRCADQLITHIEFTFA